MTTKSTILLKDAIAGYVYQFSKTASPITTRTVTAILARLDEHCGEGKLLVNLLPDHVSAFFKAQDVKKNGQPAATPTKLQVRRYVRLFLEHARETGQIDALPLPAEEKARSEEAKSAAREAKATVKPAVKKTAKKAPKSDAPKTRRLSGKNARTQKEIGGILYWMQGDKQLYPVKKAATPVEAPAETPAPETTPAA